MTATENTYVLRERLKVKIKNRRGSMTCRRCGKPINAGSRVVSKASRGHTNFYHESCFTRMFI